MTVRAFIRVAFVVVDDAEPSRLIDDRGIPRTDDVIVVRLPVAAREKQRSAAFVSFASFFDAMQRKYSVSVEAPEDRSRQFGGVAHGMDRLNAHTRSGGGR